MKLLTHNMLTSLVKGVSNGYPLRVVASKIQIRSVDFNGFFISRIIPRIDWGVLKQTADILGHGADLPDAVPADFQDNEGFLMAAHHALMEVEVIEGQLECPESGRKFPIEEGIPNMLLREEEV